VLIHDPIFHSNPPCATVLLAIADMQDAEAAAKGQVDRDQEIATGNPLLNLQAALGQTPATPGSTTSSAPSTFAVKRRWDDDLIFKNQAAGLDDKGKKGEFVNDLLRSEFHKKFMLK
jgi:protein CWC15